MLSLSRTWASAMVVIACWVEEGMVGWKLLGRLVRVFAAVLVIAVGSGMVEGITNCMARTLVGADALVDSGVNLSKSFVVEGTEVGSLNLS